AGRRGRHLAAVGDDDRAARRATGSVGKCRTGSEGGLVMMSRLLMLLLFVMTLLPAQAQAPRLSPVMPGKVLEFPRDFGAHPDFRTEWWYATGWLQTPDGKPLGFQITFFRSATDHDVRNPSAFAPQQLIIAHAAISDPQVGRLLHAENSAR